VSATISIDLPRPRTLELEESAAFGEYESSLREALRAQAQRPARFRKSSAMTYSGR
jgi:hypothetical protein